MPCYLLHMVEMPDTQSYRDPDLKDVVGQLPQLFCAHCNPPRQLMASESARCLECDGPCWRPAETICE